MNCLSVSVEKIVAVFQENFSAVIRVVYSVIAAARIDCRIFSCVESIIACAAV